MKVLNSTHLIRMMPRKSPKSRVENVFHEGTIVGVLSQDSGDISFAVRWQPRDVLDGRYRKSYRQISLHSWDELASWATVPAGPIYELALAGGLS